MKNLLIRLDDLLSTYTGQGFKSSQIPVFLDKMTKTK